MTESELPLAMPPSDALAELTLLREDLARLRTAYADHLERTIAILEAELSDLTTRAR